jgi:hypothetical protein
MVYGAPGGAIEVADIDLCSGYPSLPNFIYGEGERRRALARVADALGEGSGTLTGDFHEARVASDLIE